MGVVPIEKAIEEAQKRELDLVEISPNARPPVCRIMDYGKYRYEQQKREKLQKKRQAIIQVKEIRFHPGTAEHDFQFKLRHALKFIKDGNKIKATVVFRGRQRAHAEFGEDLLRRFAEELSDVAILEKEPTMDNRFMHIILSPKPSGKKKS